MRQRRLCVVLLLLVVLPGCNWLKARDSLNQGVRAYRETNYPSAVEHFEEALELDPELLDAELYLGMAHLHQYIPGLPTEENEAHAENAIQTFERVLQRDPQNTTAIGGLANLYQNTGEFEQAREAYKRQAEISQDDPTAYYGVGVLAWKMICQQCPDALARDPASELTQEERDAMIAEGHEYLDRAIALDEYHEFALIYKNLLLREQAYLIPEDTEDDEELARRQDLIAQADQWFDRASEARQINAEREAAGL